jgi:hypothetical protein
MIFGLIFAINGRILGDGLIGEVIVEEMVPGLWRFKGFERVDF